MSLILVTGGVRSGKSLFAERRAQEIGGKILYVATGMAYDQEMKRRIDLHKVRRPDQWGLAECSYHLDDMLAPAAEYNGILLDCLSTWVSNRLMEVPEDRIRDNQVAEKLHQDLRRWLEAVARLQKSIVIVTSEVGLGGVAMTRLGRWFQDVLGEANQQVAQEADEVYAVMSGIPWRIKG